MVSITLPSDSSEEKCGLLLRAPEVMISRLLSNATVLKAQVSVISRDTQISLKPAHTHHTKGLLGVYNQAWVLDIIMIF